MPKGVVEAVVLGLALLSVVQAVTWMDGQMAWTGTSDISMYQAYSRIGWPPRTISSSTDTPGKLAFDPVGQHLFYNSGGHLYQLSAPTSHTLLPLPPMTQVVDFTLSLSTASVLYVTQSQEVFSVPLAGASTATSLALDDYFVEQLVVDPIGGLLYFTTTDRSVYSARTDGSDVRLITTINSECSIEKYVFANNGVVYLPVVCGTRALMYMCTSGDAHCSSTIVNGVGNNARFGLVGVYPEIQSFMWFYGDTRGQGTYVTAFAREEDSIVKTDTYIISTGDTFYMLLGDCPENQAQAIALNYCHFSGVFNGTHCKCGYGLYGDQCQIPCNSEDMCRGGYCTDEGECVCEDGYHLEDVQCVINAFPPSRPRFYSTRYQEINQSNQDGIWWDYNANLEARITSQRQVETGTIFYLQNYFRARRLIVNGTNCIEEMLGYNAYPTLLFPSSTLMVSNVSCPREETRECQFWRSPNGKSLYWTTFLEDETSVMWQEEDSSNEYALIRYYSLEHTSVTSLSEGWDDTSACPCWTDSSTRCPAPPSPPPFWMSSPSPTSSPSWPLVPSSSHSPTGSPLVPSSSHSPTGSPSRQSPEHITTLTFDDYGSGGDISSVDSITEPWYSEENSDALTSPSRQSPRISEYTGGDEVSSLTVDDSSTGALSKKSSSGAPWVWIGLGVGAGVLIFVLFIVLLVCGVILCWCMHRSYSSYQPAALEPETEMEIQGYEGEDWSPNDHLTGGDLDFE